MIGRAKKIAFLYRVVIEPEGREYFGTSIELPNVFVHGSTETECFIKTREALTFAVATMLEMGDKPPMPASAGKREQQVNIRLTADERTRIEEAARQAGFRSVSDFIRAAALKHAG